MTSVMATAHSTAIRSVARQRAGEGASSWRRKVKKLRSQLTTDSSMELTTWTYCSLMAYPLCPSSVGLLSSCGTGPDCVGCHLVETEVKSQALPKLGADIFASPAPSPTSSAAA